AERAHDLTPRTCLAPSLLHTRKQHNDNENPNHSHNQFGIKLQLSGEKDGSENNKVYIQRSGRESGRILYAPIIFVNFPAKMHIPGEWLNSRTSSNSVRRKTSKPSMIP